MTPPGIEQAARAGIADPVEGPRPRFRLILRRWSLAVMYALPGSYLVLRSGFIGLAVVGALVAAALLAGTFGNRVLAGTAATAFAFVSVFILLGFSAAAENVFWIPLIAGSGVLAVAGVVVSLPVRAPNAVGRRVEAIAWLTVLVGAILLGDEMSVFHWLP